MANTNEDKVRCHGLFLTPEPIAVIRPVPPVFEVAVT